MKRKTINKVITILLVTLSVYVVLATITLAYAITMKSNVTEVAPGDRGLIAVGAGLSTGLACLGAGIGISGSGAATISAAVERPETFFRNFIIVALAEGLGIYGLIISILLWIKI